MRFSKSKSKLKVGAKMAAGQVGGTSVFICDVLSTCGVHQGTRKAKREFLSDKSDGKKRFFKRFFITPPPPSAAYSNSLASSDLGEKIRAGLHD